ncbi:hypothetical protein ACHAPX_005012 [Trichoderma viride]
MRRVYAGCNRNPHEPGYSSEQWDKGFGTFRYVTCADGQALVNAANQKPGTTRFEEQFFSSVSFSHPYEPYVETTLRSVAKGAYGLGPRWNEPCVVKWFKSSANFADVFFTLDVNAVNLAMEIVNKFNKCLTYKTIKVNIPEMWTASNDSTSPWAGKTVLCEPFIKDYQKFNSNTGWNDASATWGEIMQALSHFSYHESNGGHVLCDLQGGLNGDEAVITDPVILSRGRSHGVTDLGQEGISNFFSQHVCSVYCQDSWIKPSDLIQCFESSPKTLMIAWDGWRPSGRQCVDM